MRNLAFICFCSCDSRRNSFNNIFSIQLATHQQRLIKAPLFLFSSVSMRWKWKPPFTFCLDSSFRVHCTPSSSQTSVGGKTLAKQTQRLSLRDTRFREEPHIQTQVQCKYVIKWKYQMQTAETHGIITRPTLQMHMNVPLQGVTINAISFC